MKTTRKFIAALGTVAAATVGAIGPAGAMPATPQTFVIYAVGFPEHNNIVAAGPIQGRGVETESPVSHRDNPDGSSTFRLVSEVTLERGRVVLVIDGDSWTSFDPRSCVETTTGTISWALLPERGTGAYAGATGSGTGSFDDRFIAQRNADGCDEQSGVTNVFVARLHGAAAVPTTAAA